MQPNETTQLSLQLIELGLDVVLHALEHVQVLVSAGDETFLRQSLSLGVRLDSVGVLVINLVLAGHGTPLKAVLHLLHFALEQSVSSLHRRLLVVAATLNFVDACRFRVVAFGQLQVHVSLQRTQLLHFNLW